MMQKYLAKARHKLEFGRHIPPPKSLNPPQMRPSRSKNPNILSVAQSLKPKPHPPPKTIPGFRFARGSAATAVRSKCPRLQHRQQITRFAAGPTLPESRSPLRADSVPAELRALVARPH